MDTVSLRTLAVSEASHAVNALHDEYVGDEQVGLVWVGPHANPARSGEQDVAWLYDIEIDPAHRGRGLGRAALAALESYLVERGCRETTVHMSKHLAGGAADT